MMDKKGLSKLVEECGELIQIAAKKMAYLESDEHPDGKGSLNIRLQDEIADVQAACSFVMAKLDLDPYYVVRRVQIKLKKYDEWDSEA